MRDLINILEDVNDDVSMSALAHNAYRAVYGYVYYDRKLDEMEFNGRTGVSIFLRDIEDADPAFAKTCVIFAPPLDPANRGAETHYANEPIHGCNTFVIFTVATADKAGILYFLSGDEYQFQHEMIHVLDGQRFKVRPNDLPYADHTKGLAGYYNDPVELNAYFHNIAEPLLTRMQMVKSDGVEALGLFDPIPEDFRVFLADRIKRLYHQPLKKFWSHLSEENKRRMITRLHALHAELMRMATDAP